MRVTRRAWFSRFLAVAAALRKAAATARPLQVDRFRNENLLPSLVGRQRTYRADAVVSLLGVPIFSRASVGGAFAILREASQDGRRVVSLEFAGGANPARTHGIHYFGSTEEVILERPGEPLEAACFGFVTARPGNQEGFDQARQHLLASDSHPASSVIAVEETVRQYRLHNTAATLPVEDLAWENWPEIAKQVRSEFARSNATSRQVEFPAQASTFLYAVLSAMRAPGRTSLYCLHNAKPYRLDCDKTPDCHAGGNFSAKNLSACPQSVVRLTGQIHDLTKRHTTTFKLWLDAASQLPIRIEYSPRSYLRVALELDPALEQPVKRKEDA